MVSSIIGSYLIQKKIITPLQYEKVLENQQKVRVKLGLIAVSEGLMTQADADRVNQLQAIKDKRFGDIAVELGLLSQRQVDTLLKKQGNAYMAFAQSLSDLEIMDIYSLEDYLKDFERENGFTKSDIEAIKSDEVERILPLYLPPESEKYYEICGVLFRTLIRFVDNMAYPDKGCFVSSVKADNAALQSAVGKWNITTGMVGIEKSLLPLAQKFGMCEFDEVDEEVMDAVAEFINCVNGLYASAVSSGGVELDLKPPKYAVNISEVMADNMLTIPVHVGCGLAHFVVSFNEDILMRD